MTDRAETSALGETKKLGAIAAAEVVALLGLAPHPEGGHLAGCTVAPAFQFAGFALAPPGWRPGD